MGGGGGVPGGLGGHVAGGHAPPPHPSNLSAVHYASGPAVVSLNEHERVVTSLQDQLLHARGEIDRLVGRLNDFERDRLAAAAAAASHGAASGGVATFRRRKKQPTGRPWAAVSAAAAAAGMGGMGVAGVGGVGGTGRPPPQPPPPRYPRSQRPEPLLDAEEHQRFLDAMERFGPKDVRAIAAYVGSRNATQVRTHSQKYTLRLQRENRELPLAGTRKRSMSESDLRRVGRDGAEEPDRPFGGGAPTEIPRHPLTVPRVGRAAAPRGTSSTVYGYSPADDTLYLERQLRGTIGWYEP
ncbi:hypothetical protein I4F81_003214 [Pyropia yezoensis]|uniref:Uncharacterized protein n=1 Tax=Pyropia yezoensis TaxID=2788 RepID=A0ACC3BRJ6_PYRYE|nr:hypothetical protein I4F81_003214 [Neopyropia yezoensis]